MNRAATDHKTVIVVGAGLCGLTAAHRLQQAGLAVTVLERDDAVGGCARTERRAGYVIDTGPDVINTSYGRLLSLVTEIGLGQSIVRSSQVVDVIRAGRPIEVDRGRPLSLIANPVLTWRSKLSLAWGYLKLRTQLRNFDPYAMSTQADRQDQGTAYDFASKYFPDEVIEYLLDPILRAFAGTSARQASGLAVLNALSVGTRELVNVRGGIDTIPRRLADDLDVRCGAAVTDIKESDGSVIVCYEAQGRSHQIKADACLLAVQFHDARSFWPVLDKVVPGAGDGLVDIPMISVSVGYDVVPGTRAYSVLVPSVESDEAILLLMQQNKSDDRVPPGRSLVTLYTELGTTQRFMAQPDDEIATWAGGVIESYYPALAGHRDLSVVTRWNHSGYRPSPGYWRSINEIRSSLPRGRVHAAGALYGSGGLERAVLAGERAAERLLREIYCDKPAFDQRTHTTQV